jgi:PAS domain S-box-containing protein
MIKKPSQTAKQQKPEPSHLHQKAFDNSLMANIISVVQDGKIIAVNRASEKLLGYSKKILLTKNLKDIFNTEDRGFTQMRKQREIAGYATGNLIGVKKTGRRFPVRLHP